MDIIRSIIAILFIIRLRHVINAVLLFLLPASILNEVFGVSWKQSIIYTLVAAVILVGVPLLIASLLDLKRQKPL